jgi:two-component system, NarL family, invasion response regulator UvrY
METILIADDHEIIRRGVRMIVESLPQQYRVIEAASCADVIKTLSSGKIHYSILDMTFSDGNILFDTELLTTYSAATDILVYSMSSENIYARRLLQKGVKGFVCKKAGIEDLEKAIRSLLAGETYISPVLTKALLDPSRSNESKNPIDTLSDRELAVVEYITAGMGAKEIAHKLNLDITTISTYRKRALNKLNVQNIFELRDKLMLYKI